MKQHQEHTHNAKPDPSKHTSKSTDKDSFKQTLNHPVSKVILGAGGFLVSLYFLSYLLHAGSKVASAYRHFKRAVNG